MTRTFLCAVLAALAVPALALAFPNTEPLGPQQWYLEQDRAWDFWPQQPTLKTVKVAVIDSGIDYGHPEFAGRIVAGRSFVGGTWKRDTDGHGTFVAGIIAADPANGQGIAGMAFNAQLLIAKVVPPDESGVNLTAEADAIRWSVREGAQVINLSLGGNRDPQDPRIDTYSPLERAAIEYAVSKGVVVVAAAGNGTEAPSMPWPYADYPAALPHVLGVGALREDGSVPEYSNRDPVYVDIAAPGDGIVSTIPRNLVDATQPNCADVPYSTCGPTEFRDAIGTSFAAPQVAAAAALVLGVDPHLTADQVVWLLERSARDMSAADGCPQCPLGRDSLTGWGRVDVAHALEMLQRHVALPRPDPYLPNDDAGAEAYPLPAPRTITNTLDYWDDPVNVFSLRLRKGERLYARLSPSTRGAAGLELWKPGTQHVDVASSVGDVAATGVSIAGQKRITYVVPATGAYYVEVKFLPPARPLITYTLSLATKTP